MPRKKLPWPRGRYLFLGTALLTCAVYAVLRTRVARTASPSTFTGSIQVDAARITGTVPRYLFGQFMEHEHNTIDNGLLAQLLQDRKFDEGSMDDNGVSYDWVPEERVRDKYWQLKNGKGAGDQYYIDHKIYYGRLGSSQAIQLSGSGTGHASVYQIGLQFAGNRRYEFYVYLRKQGTGKAFIEIGRSGGRVYVRKDFDDINSHWTKHSFVHRS